MKKVRVAALCSLVFILLLFSDVAQAQGSYWRPLGPEGGSITAMAIDPAAPQTVYAGTSRGFIYKSINGGGAWISSSEGLPGSNINVLAMDPTDSQTIFAATNAYIYKSTNGGTTWSRSGSQMTGPDQATFLEFDPSNPHIIYAGEDTYPYRYISTDGGDTWVGQSTLVLPYIITAWGINPQAPQNVYICAYTSTISRGSVRRSSDGGNTWTSSTEDVRKVRRFIFDPTTTQIAYASSNGGIFRTLNGGENWTNVSSWKRYDSNTVLVMDPSAHQILYAGDYDQGVYKSTDGGTTWNPQNEGLSDISVLSLAIDPIVPQTIYAGTNGGGVFISTDGGDSWQPVNAGLLSANINTIAVDPANPKIIYGHAQGIGIIKSSNGGNTWVVQNQSLGQLWNLIIDPANPQTLYALTGSDNYTEFNKIFKSLNEGVDWFAIDAEIGDAVRVLAMDPFDAQTLYAGTYLQGLYKSTDGGMHWEKTGFDYQTQPTAIIVDPTSSRTVYVGSWVPNGFYKSTDAGTSWSQTGTGLPNSNYLLQSLAIHPNEPQTIYAGTSKGIYKSINGSEDWSAISSDGFVVNYLTLEIDPANSQALYAGRSAGGLYQSVNAGANWSIADPALSTLYVRSVKFTPADPSKLYIGTNEGVWVYSDAALSNITIAANPPGCSYRVEDTSYTGSHTFSWEAGSRITISARPQQETGGERCVFGNWSDSGTDSHEITVPAGAATITANFTSEYRLTTSFSPSSGGSISASPSSADGYYASGTAIRLTANPNPGYSFLSWSGDLTGTTNPQTITMSAPRNVTAAFVRLYKDITITASPVGRSFSVDGTTYTTAQTFSWEVGSSHTIAVTTPQGSGGTRYVFANWSDGGALSHTITVPAEATTYTANFATQFQLTTTCSPSNGGSISASPSSADGFYASGTSVQLTATANSGYSFVGWSGSATGIINPKSLTMTAPRTVTTYFQLASANYRPSRLSPQPSTRTRKKRDIRSLPD